MKRFFLIAVLGTAAFAAAAEQRLRDYDAELGTAYRSDLVGPEMWTVTDALKGRYSGKPASYRTMELPSEVWRVPRPGLQGRLYIVHDTGLDDALSLVVEDGGASLDLVAVRNRWTPGGMDTFYRSASLDRPDDDPEVGSTVLHERKCILDDNVFVAEATLKNTSATSRTYRVRIVAADALPRKPGPFAFTTTSMCRPTARTCFGALRTTDGRLVRTFVLAPGARRTFRYGFAVGGASAAAVGTALDRALAAPDPFAGNARCFSRWMEENAPELDLSDGDLYRLWVYRWYLLWRGTHVARRVIPDHEYPRAAVYESPMGEWFGCVIGLPVPMQVQELAWMRDPSVGRSHLLNWCEKVVGYRGYIQFTGMAAWRFCQNHPDAAFAKRICPELLKDALHRQGKDPSRLPVQRGSWSTGAEYQANFYQFVTPKWDYRHDHEFNKRDKERFPVASMIRLDTAGFVLGDLLGCSRLATLAGDADAARDSAARAAAGLETIRRRHWDERLGLFLAADPETGRLADEAACYDSFVPYMWGMVREPEYLRAFDKFCDPAWFWDDCPISTVAKTCPMYCGGNYIRGPFLETSGRNHRYGCCWNGPAWHYADSLAAEAFGQAAQADPSRRAAWLEYFRAWTLSHYLYGDRTVPRAAENFRPEDGARVGCAYDYLHSSWIDPFLRWWCGISVSDDLKTVAFEPFATGNFRVARVPVAGRELTFESKSGALTVADAAGRVLASGKGRLTLAAR